MKKKEAGQALILVLILLVIGAMLVIPMLQFVFTASKGSQIVTQNLKNLYAAEGGQEYAAWKLKYGGLTNLLLTIGSTTLSVNVCDIPVELLIIMRAVPGGGGLILATNDVIRPTKTVSASNPVSPETPDHVANDSYQTFTYIIRLEQLSENTTQGLDAVYDILPKDLGINKYVSGSSYIRVDGGPWESIGNPLRETVSSQDRLRWPASGSFSSPIRDFTPRQVKELKFQVVLQLPSSSRDTIQVNWVVLKPWNTVSGPQAPITVGSPNPPNVYKQNGLIEVVKTAVPDIIPPGVERDVMYTITMTNRDGNTHHIERITDYLPPEFYYTDNTSNPPSLRPSGITTATPQQTIKNINGVTRQELVWNLSPQPSIAEGQTLTLTFWARTTKNVSGTYYNEVIVDLADVPNVPTIFSGIGVSQTDFYPSYSWIAGAVTLPTYDSSSTTTSTTIFANMGLTASGVDIYSWHVR
jgi:hypothetical protein